MKKSNYASIILSGNACQCRSMEKGPVAWAPPVILTGSLIWSVAALFTLLFGSMKRQNYLFMASTKKNC